jgi:hypothetical protein
MHGRPWPHSQPISVGRDLAAVSYRHQVWRPSTWPGVGSRKGRGGPAHARGGGPGRLLAAEHGRTLDRPYPWTVPKPDACLENALGAASPRCRPMVSSRVVPPRGMGDYGTAQQCPAAMRCARGGAPAAWKPCSPLSPYGSKTGPVEIRRRRGGGWEPVHASAAR